MNEYLEGDQPNDVPRGFDLDCVLRGHKERITALTWVPGTNYLLSASKDCHILLWNLARRRNEKEAFKVLSGHTETVNDVIVDSRGRAISCSEDKTLIVWDLKTGEKIATLEGHEDFVTSLRCAPTVLLPLLPTT